MEMRTYIKISLVVLCLMAVSFVKAQDYHLSQYDAVPQYTNPALTGMYFSKGIDYRITSDYRSQWRSLVRKPFVTTSISYDQKLRQRFGVGGYVINSKAGTLGFYTFDAMLSAAYKIINNPDGKHHLSVGLQMGMMQKGYNPSQFTFDSQYSAAAGDFDTSIPTGEGLNSINILKYDANMGVYYKNTDSEKKIRPFGGFSVYHLTVPNEAFTATKTNLPARFIVNAGTEYQSNERLLIVPSVLYMRQEKARELNMGAQFFYSLNDTSKFTPMAGFYYRNKDSFIVQLGLKHGNNLYRISYDVNNSSLKNYSNGKGALEFSFIYCIKAKPKEQSPSFD